MGNYENILLAREALVRWLNATPEVRGDPDAPLQFLEGYISVLDEIDGKVPEQTQATKWFEQGRQAAKDDLGCIF